MHMIHAELATCTSLSTCYSTHSRTIQTTHGLMQCSDDEQHRGNANHGFPARKVGQDSCDQAAEKGSERSDRCDGFLPLIQFENLP